MEGQLSRNTAETPVYSNTYSAIMPGTTPGMEPAAENVEGGFPWTRKGKVPVSWLRN